MAAGKSGFSGVNSFAMTAGHGWHAGWLITASSLSLRLPTVINKYVLVQDCREQPSEASVLCVTDSIHV
jgi:hypothetical protein